MDTIEYKNEIWTIIKNKKIEAGTVITGPNWSDPVIVNLIEVIGEYVRISGKKIKTYEHIDQLLTLQELLEIKNEKENGIFNQEARKVFLALECKRYRYASLYDPLLAVNISKVDPLPHQIDAVYNYVFKLPRIRFLIADDPGAGKTIMAGLIIKVLKLRQLIERILIVVPGHLKDQWKIELYDKFEENFEIIDGKNYYSTYRTNL